MFLKAHLFPFSGSSHDLIASFIPEKEREIISSRWSIRSDDQLLKEIFTAAKSTDEFWLSVESVLSKSELEQLSHFEILCRKVISESNKDNKINQPKVDRFPLIGKDGIAKIRLPSGFALSRIEMKPNMVGAIGDWAEEYVVGSAVAKVFTDSGFSGFSLLPIQNPKTNSAHDDYYQVFSETILQPLEVDCSVESIKSSFQEENGALRLLGCLSYYRDQLLPSIDFTRTAESWGGWSGSPTWVVSKAVVKAFTKNKLRGWAFRPVLIKETQVYETYVSEWKKLNELVAQYPNVEFDGGRW